MLKILFVYLKNMSIVIKDKSLIEMSVTPEGLEIIKSKLSQWYAVEVYQENELTVSGNATVLSSTFISNGKEIVNRHIALMPETIFIFSNIKENELGEFIKSELPILVRDLKIINICQ